MYIGDLYIGPDILWATLLLIKESVSKFSRLGPSSMMENKGLEKPKLGTT